MKIRISILLLGGLLTALSATAGERYSLDVEAQSVDASPLSFEVLDSQVVLGAAGDESVELTLEVQSLGESGLNSYAWALELFAADGTSLGIAAAIEGGDLAGGKSTTLQRSLTFPKAASATHAALRPIGATLRGSAGPGGSNLCNPAIDGGDPCKVFKFACNNLCMGNDLIAGAPPAVNSCGGCRWAWDSNKECWFQSCFTLCGCDIDLERLPLMPADGEVFDLTDPELPPLDPSNF
ncbi:MAG: hypothetical protein AAF604_22525 [Acidobacteriota bacterium]